MTPPIPHWNFPVTFNTTSGVGAVQQGTLDEVFANVRTIIACPQGACPEIPSLGIPSVAFQPAPVNAQALVDAIQAQEPRAAQALAMSGTTDLGQAVLNLTTQFAAGDQ